MYKLGFLYIWACWYTSVVAEIPSFLVILIDDVGYGDISAYNQPCPMEMLCPAPQTPRIDQVAKEGVLLTDFYTGHASCTPSRSAMLTGRLPIRTGVYPDVYTPLSNCGMPPEEITVAEALQEQGYSTSWVGKWHLGHLHPFLPTRQGFDSFFGMPYSHDMCPCPQSLTGTSDPEDCHEEEPGCPLLEDELIVEQPAILQTLTQRYADRAIEYLTQRDEDGKPFFLMTSFQHAHEPQFISPAFNHSAPEGDHQVYGDSMLEQDYHIGRIMHMIRQSKSLSERLIVFLASDNGPSLISLQYGGSPGSLRCGKSTTWEGGHRVPSLVWGPGMGIPQGKVIDGIVSNLDWMPTILSMAGVPLPKDVKMDGVDVSQLLTGQQDKSPRDTMFFYGRQGTLNAVRHGRYKLHYFTSGWGGSPEELCGPKDFIEHDPPLLFDLENDIFENYSIPSTSMLYRVVHDQITQLVKEHNSTLTVGDFTLTEDEIAMPWPPQPFHPWTATYDGPLCVDIPSNDSSIATRPWRQPGFSYRDGIDRLTWYEMGTRVYQSEGHVRQHKQ